MSTLRKTGEVELYPWVPRTHQTFLVYDLRGIPAVSSHFPRHPNTVV